MYRALNRSHPLSKVPHFPRDVLEALGVMTSCPLDVTTERWPGIKDGISAVADSFPSSDGVNAPLLRVLLDRYGMGGRSWVDALTKGFPLSGRTPYRGFSPSAR